MVDGAPSSDPENEPTQREDLPDRLRVHSLARTLGTSSRRVLDALSALDGRIRSAHSSVDRVDAVRVRDLLAEQPAEEGQAEEGQQAPDAVAAEVPDAPGEPAEPDEPESRLMLETQETVQVVETWVERPHYMPLFVAPQPISEPVAGDDADDESGDEGDDDEEQADRPAPAPQVGCW